VTFRDAVSLRIVSPTIWTRDNAGRQYVAATALSPYAGYWIFCGARHRNGNHTALH